MSVCLIKCLALTSGTLQNIFLVVETTCPLAAVEEEDQERPRTAEYLQAQSAALDFVEEEDDDNRRGKGIHKLFISEEKSFHLSSYNFAIAHNKPGRRIRINT